MISHEGNDPIQQIYEHNDGCNATYGYVTNHNIDTESYVSIEENKNY